MLGGNFVISQKNKTPGNRGFNTVNFRIHKISHSDQESCQCNHNRYPVHCPCIILFFLADEKPYRQKNSYPCAVTCKTSMPDCEYFHGMFKIITGFIKKAMTQPGTDYGSESHVHGKPVEDSFTQVFVPEHLINYNISEKER